VVFRLARHLLVLKYLHSSGETPELLGHKSVGPGPYRWGASKYTYSILVIGKRLRFPQYRLSRSRRVDGDQLRILIADDHEAVRKGVCFILDTRDDLEVCAEASSGFEAIGKTIELGPDLIIMDLNMPGMDGLAACKQIKSFQPQIPVLIFSQHDGNEIVLAARQARAQGFVTKSGASAVLLKAIDALLDGKTFFPDETSQPLSKTG
jgi:CheY-like chemotaxis protein